MHLPMLLIAALGAVAVADACRAQAPVRVIYDTDMGNDIDDALALAMLHGLQSRGECELLAVTSSKAHPHSPLYCDLVNAFYGRSEIPVGAVKEGKTPQESRYVTETVLAKTEDGQWRHPRRLARGEDAPDAVALLRKTLSKQPDESVVVIVVGFSTNLANLLQSEPDEHSSLTGVELVRQKCRLLSMMAGMFSEDRHREYNVYVDAPAARRVFADWPTPIVISGFEVGRAIKYPAESIEKDFRYVEHHPVADAYRLYKEMPYDRETWDLTSVLYAVRPDRGYFGLSEPGEVTVDDGDVTHFKPTPEGTRRYLIVTDEQLIRVREALVQLASQPPCVNGRSRSDN